MAILNTATYVWPVTHAPSVAEAATIACLVVDLKIDVNDQTNLIEITHNMGIPGLDPKITYVCTTVEDDLENVDPGIALRFTDATKCTFESRAGAGTRDIYRVYIERLVRWNRA